MSKIDVSDVNRKVNSVTRKAKSLEQRVNELEKRLGAGEGGPVTNMEETIAQMQRRVEAANATVVMHARALQVYNLRLAVLTETAFVRRLKSSPKDFTTFAIALIEMMDEPDSWWNDRKNLLVRDWIKLVEERVEARQVGDVARLLDISEAEAWRYSHGND